MTMRKLILSLLFAPWLALAQPEAPQVIEKSLSDPLTFSVVHATTMTDGSPITGVIQTRFYWTHLVDGQCGSWLDEVSANWPLDRATIPASRIGEGDFCVFAYYVHPACTPNEKACEAANHVEVRITDGNVTAPMLSVTEPDAWYPFEQPNSYTMVRIGTFPIGTPCLSEWPVGPYYLVDTSLGFVPTLPDQVVPQVLAAHCE